MEIKYTGSKNTYKVLDPHRNSRSGQSYIVRQSGDGKFFTCECLDFHTALRLGADDKDCAHIKYVRQNMISGKINVRKKTNIIIDDLVNEPAEAPDRISCPKCGSTKRKLSGKYKSNRGIEQRYECKSCKSYYQSLTKFKSSKFHPKIIRMAISYMNEGKSVSQILGLIYAETGVRTTDVTIYGWRKKFADMICLPERVKTNQKQKHRIAVAKRKGMVWIKREAIRLYETGLSADETVNRLAKMGIKIKRDTIWAWMDRAGRKRADVPKVFVSDSQKIFSRTFTDKNIVQYARNAMLEGISVSEIQSRIKDEFSRTISQGTLYRWLASITIRSNPYLQKYSKKPVTEDDIVKYATNAMLEGVTVPEIQNMIKDKFSKTISHTTLYRWRAKTPIHA